MTSTPHLRSAPSPSTPASTSPLLFSILNTLTYPYILFIGVPSLAYSSLKYLLSPRPFASWSLFEALFIKYKKVQNGPSSFVLPPLPPSSEEWTVPATQFNTVSQDEVKRIDIKVVSVPPVPAGMQTGIALCPAVESVLRPGFWLTPDTSKGRADEKAKEGEKVVLHLHGGGYVRGHPLWIDCPHGIALTLDQRLFSMNYRKCLSDSTAFPAPLLDALAGYIYLTRTLSFPPEAITLIGESAGAHLCLILSRYLSDLSLPQPGRLVLISPWADFTMNPADLRGTYASYADYDFLLPDRLAMGARSATRHYTPEMVRGAYFSPALARAGEYTYLGDWDDAKRTRVMLVYGTKEVFEDEDKAVVAGMVRDRVDVAVYTDIDGWHTKVSGEPVANKKFRQGLLEWSNET